MNTKFAFVKLETCIVLFSPNNLQLMSQCEMRSDFSSFSTFSCILKFTYCAEFNVYLYYS